MKQVYYILLLVILFSFTHCKRDISGDTQSDEEFIAFITDTTYTKTLKRIDSIAKRNPYSTHQTGLLYYEKGRVLGILEKDVEAVGSLKKALISFKKEGDEKFIAQTHMFLGDSEAFLSNNDVASVHITKALHTFKDIQDRKGEARALNSLGHIEFQYENFIKSIAYVKQAAIIQSEMNDRDELTASYNNIGYILEQSGNLSQAKEYYQKAIVLNGVSTFIVTFF